MDDPQPEVESDPSALAQNRFPVPTSGWSGRCRCCQIPIVAGDLIWRYPDGQIAHRHHLFFGAIPD